MKKFLLVTFPCWLMLSMNACTSTAPLQEKIVADAFNQTAIPVAWQATKTAGEFDQQALGFDVSPELQALMKEAIAYNVDLKIASARIDQSRAVLKSVGGSLLPNVGVGAQTGTSTLPTSTSAISGFGLIASWDLDLWGRVRSDQSASQARLMSAQLDSAFAKQSIAAQVVKSWIVISELMQQVQLSENMVAIANQQLDLMKVGLNVGRNSQQEILLNESLLRNYQSQLIANQQSLGNAKRALEILLGRYPSTQIQAGQTFPKIVSELPAGIPSQILSRRPDVLAAEERFKASFQDVEAAKRAKLPSIKITGGIGYIENSAIQLSNAISNPISSLTAQLLMPLFLGGQLDAQVEAKTASQTQSLAQYQKSALNALSEVESGLANDRLLRQRELILQAQLQALQSSVKYALIQKEVGKGDMFQYLQQQLNANSSQANLLRIQSDHLLNRISLHQALGGQFI
ncbi:efflux transporter, outer membrane factor (OMF) lipoprotein, NodT family [Polynucleobacter kasalickyi]|uniref:Efflux transporter, outer membrane factor (OMF) lipoprotein, NodT family n=2 Tax=Polynucleobacter kasalickyi TaxID=1938817 RepID=A0A1W2B2Z8_9BURK|nr:efflux transporter, outer membrane factor (OMF) lipoprotein, NodT family [Polynucleobacter kasalickyi]